MAIAAYVQLTSEWPYMLGFYLMITIAIFATGISAAWLADRMGVPTADSMFAQRTGISGAG
jgi:hypothetical protein